MRIEKEILVNILKILFVSSLTTGSAGFNEFDGGNMILFQIEVFGRNIKMENILQRFNCISFLFKPPWYVQYI